MMLLLIMLKMRMVLVIMGMGKRMIVNDGHCDSAIGDEVRKE